MKIVGKEFTPSGKVKKCTLVFDSVVNPLLLKYPKLAAHCRRLRGTNLVYEMKTDDKGRLCLMFASGYFNGRGFRKKSMLKSAIKILNAVPESILMEDPAYLAVWNCATNLVPLKVAARIFDRDNFEKNAFKEVQRIYEREYVKCHAFMKVFDHEVNLMRSKLETLKKEAK